MKKVTLPQVDGLIKQALDDLYKEYETNTIIPVEICERSIMFRLGYHLQKIIDGKTADCFHHISNSPQKIGNKDKKVFCGFTVDCEYNKIKRGRKMVDTSSNKKCATLKELYNSYCKVRSKNLKKYYFYPDTIIHKRNTDDNLVAIEIKKIKSKNAAKEYDKAKLKYYSCCNCSNRPSNCLAYQYGVFIELGEQRNNSKITYFQNGKEITID